MKLMNAKSLIFLNIVCLKIKENINKKKGKKKEGGLEVAFFINFLFFYLVSFDFE